MIGFTVIVISNGISELGKENYKGITNRELWKRYEDCTSDAGVKIIGLCNTIMFFMAQIFIVNSKNFWDAIYFEKINHIYNTQYIFGSCEKVGLRKLHEQSKRQLEFNRVTKKVVFIGILCDTTFYVF